MSRLAVALTGGVALVASFVACDDDPRYVYTARRYDEANGCLEGYSAIERVPGDSVSVRCAPACLAVRDVLYVSPVCPPLPDVAVAVDASDPRCEAALAAYQNETLCGATEEEEGDGGGEEEGGAEEDAEADAGTAEDAAGD